jgi:hypothetical protein
LKNNRNLPFFENRWHHFDGKFSSVAENPFSTQSDAAELSEFVIKQSPTV